MTAPLGKTTFGVTVWPVPVGRTPGQQTGLEHLAWGGPGDAIRLHADGISDGRMELYGAASGTVSGPCPDDTEAQYAVDVYLRHRVTEALAPAQDAARSASPWLEEILRTAGETGPAIGSEIRQAAENSYRQTDGERGEAWAQYNARQTAKAVLATAATSNNPEVQAALRAYKEAREQADSLIDDLDSPDWHKRAAADAADAKAEFLQREYHKTWMSAQPRHEAEVRKAWREPDRDFVRSHLEELKAADPALFKSITSARWLARISPPVTPTGPGAGLARTGRRPSQQVPRQARGRR